MLHLTRPRAVGTLSPLTSALLPSAQLRRPLPQFPAAASGWGAVATNTPYIELLGPGAVSKDVGRGVVGPLSGLGLPLANCVTLGEVLIPWDSVSSSAKQGFPGK